MNIPSAWQSQIDNLRLFRSWVRLRRLLADAPRVAAGLLSDGRAGRYPLTVNVISTNRCDLSCRHCYNLANRPAADELETAEIAALVREAGRFGAGIFLSGGEPLLRDDALDLMALARQCGATTGLVTNGTRLSPRMTGRLIELAPALVMLSFRGSRDLHDRFVRRDGAYDELLAATHRLAAGLPAPGPVVNLVLTEEAVPVAREFLDDILQVRNVVPRLVHLSFLTRAEREAHRAAWRARVGEPVPAPLTFRYEVRPERFLPVADLLRDPRYASVVSRPVLSPQETLRWYTPGFVQTRPCLFVWHSTFVNADGTVYPCQYYPWPLGNIREQSLEAIWNGERYRAFRLVMREGLLPGCSRCCKL